jgi:hypothetical protein
MEVAPAIVAAKKYTKAKDPKHEVIRFAPGLVYAQTEHAGVIILCPDVTWEAAADAAQLVAMVKKAGDNATFALDRNTLVITSAAGHGYRLQCIEARSRDKLPSAPEAPRRFVDLDEATFRSLVQVAGLALAGDDDATLAAVRITPSWAASSRGSALAVLWLVDGAGAPLDLVREPLSVDAKFFSGLRGPMSLSATKAFFWLRAGDVTRWAHRLDVPWPDSAVSAENLQQLRHGGDNRLGAAVNVAELRHLFDRALAAADSKADAFRLTWGAHLGVTGGGMKGRFAGSAGIPVDGGGRTFGVAPAVWLRYLDALGACCEGEVYMSIAGTTDPAALWATKPLAFEVFIWPEYIPAE